MKRVSKAVKVRDIQIGGGAPVVVQSMTKTDTTDVAGIDAKLVDACIERFQSEFVVKMNVRNDRYVGPLADLVHRGSGIIVGNGDATSMVRQGVTTMVFGEGGSAAPSKRWKDFTSAKLRTRQST